MNLHLLWLYWWELNAKSLKIREKLQCKNGWAVQSASGKLQKNIWKILQLLLNDEKLSRIFMVWTLIKMISCWLKSPQNVSFSNVKIFKRIFEILRQNSHSKIFSFLRKNSYFLDRIFSWQNSHFWNIWIFPPKILFDSKWDFYGIF